MDRTAYPESSTVLPIQASSHHHPQTEPRGHLQTPVPRQDDMPLSFINVDQPDSSWLQNTTPFGELVYSLFFIIPCQWIRCVFHPENMMREILWRYVKKRKFSKGVDIVSMDGLRFWISGDANLSELFRRRAAILSAPLTEQSKSIHSRYVFKSPTEKTDTESPWLNIIWADNIIISIISTQHLGGDD